ncbi:MAG: hypothetical protein AAB600_00965 [Patescibacteria group bacterium]
MKILRFVWNNILFFISLFLLVFVPLYPKLPILDVQNTWVYVRVEDFIITFVILIWIVLFLFKKITINTPLTLPILLFWITGGVSLLHAVLVIFPTIANVFPNVAFLSFLRRIEYVFLFFVAFAGMRDKRLIYYIIYALPIILLVVVGYGFGQKFFGFPAFLTMNEEFAKGVPIQLSQLSRVPSTFAGHYDLAAYLVLLIPILVSLAFGFKNWLIKIFLLGVSSLGFVLLLETVSRVSFSVLLLALVMLLIFQKKRLVIISLFVLTVILLILSPSLLQRFGSTVSEIDVLVDAKTGRAIGHVTEVPSLYFEDKIVLRDFAQSEQNPKLATSSAIVPKLLIPSPAVLVTEPNESTGENLPQGTSYINLPLSPVVKKVNQYFYQKAKENNPEQSTKIYMLYGDFLIKKAKAYDLSFTTRFQGEWPKTITAFMRNIFLGSGYGSVSLAVDNNYLRILGETGILGLVSFLSIFIVAGIFIKKILPVVASPVVRSFVLGFVAGTFGLFLNAILIDVFEASKIAFSYWLLMGVTLGILNLHKSVNVDIYKEFKNLITSTYAIVIYLFILTISLYFSLSNYYFTGDDFTWFRWVSDCCNGLANNGIVDYFTNANGFFYRPGTKVYFFLMHSAFWLNQTMYHLVSLILHFSVAALLFLILKRILKNYFLSAAAAIVFLILSGHHEAIFWISATGFLFNAFFALLSLLFFIYWKENKKNIYLLIAFVAVFLSLLFHELGVIAPLLIILYDSVFGEKFSLSNLYKKSYYYILIFPIIPYLILRFIAKSHWFSGDYSYNIFNLPYNFIGNTMGYLGLSVFGPLFLTIYNSIRNFSKGNLGIALLASIVIIFAAFFLWKWLMKALTKDDSRIVVFGVLFFAISLLPFLGLGTITSRYSYLSSVGLAILLAFFIKKLYKYLILSNEKYIAVSIVTIIVIIFLANQVFQLQKINSDWKTAGEKSKRFVVSLEEMYEREWKNDSLKFYFVDVPIRNGEAWIFPVGLPDAVWLLFRNKNIDIYQLRSLKEVIGSVKDPRTEKVFEFDEQGGVVERKKAQDGSVIPIDK